MVVGLALVVVGLSQARERARPAGALVTVNGVALDSNDLRARLTSALRRNSALDDEQLRELIDKLVLEEVVYQHGMAMGLARSDGLLRRRVIQIVRDMATAEARAKEPEQAMLRRYYTDHRSEFAGPEQLRISEIFLAKRKGRDNAEEIDALRRRLSEGASFETLRTEASDPPVVDLSRGWHSLDTIENKLGDAFGRAARATRPGKVSPAVKSRHGYHLLRVEQRRAGPPLSFEQARKSVRSRYLRQATRDHLATYLKRVRERADVWMAPDLLARLRTTTTSARQDSTAATR